MVRKKERSQCTKKNNNNIPFKLLLKSPPTLSSESIIFCFLVLKKVKDQEPLAIYLVMTTITKQTIMKIKHDNKIMQMHDLQE